jgi:Protein of unknown function (DUF3151)
MTGPEEPPQAVAEVPGHDVEMDVGHALADDLVQRKERSFGPQHRRLGGCDPPSGLHHRAEQAARQLRQGRVVPARDDEGMAVEHGPVVEERDEVRLVKDHVGRSAEIDDPVENAFWREHEITLWSHMAEIPLGSSPPETVLPEWPREAELALKEAMSAPDPFRAMTSVAARFPRYLSVWAALSEHSDDSVTAYAFARTGYHRGLDTLRAAGWRGSGYVRWRHPSNQGFLRSLDALRRRASEISEKDEEERCALFLRQLDPEWDRLDRESSDRDNREQARPGPDSPGRS